MPQDRFLIGFTDNNGGLQTNVKPWLINDNAFSSLENAYVWRGRVRKRCGSILMGSSQLNSRVRINLGTTDSNGDFAASTPGSIHKVGQMFSVGTEIFTVYQDGTPADTLSTGSGSATYNTFTGSLVITGASATTSVYFYPADPIMGISQYSSISSSNMISFAFDTQFAYYFSSSTNSWIRSTGFDDIWTGDNSQFFWSTNYIIGSSGANYLFVTNNNPEDGIRYYDGTTWVQPLLNYSKGSVVDTTDSSGNASGTLTGTFFLGQVFTIGITTFTVTAASGALTVSEGGTGTGTFNISTGAYTFTAAYASTSIFFTGNNYIKTARLLLPFKDRLLLFNTTEVIEGTDTQFINRVRWSAVGSPLTPSSFMDDFPGNGSGLDADTFEEIITAQFIKDRLIVYFESSTYELVYNSNQVYPFSWQRIDNTLGAESTFSMIPLDKIVIGIGNTGIHACNGINVSRIDTKIPQLVFSFHNENAGVDRVYGIRDYYSELIYWTYPSENRDDSFYFPNKVLVYNYINDTWSINDDSFTAFGYYLLELGTPGATWENTITPWQENINLWNSQADGQVNVKFKTIITGNQEGFMSIIRPDILRNAPSLQITNIDIIGAASITIDCINHNLAFKEYVLLENVNGITFTTPDGDELSSVIGRVSSDPFLAATPDVFDLFLVDNDDLPITISGTYTGGGTIARVSEIDIVTKQYNFYTAADRNVYVPKIDFLIDRTDIGEITVDYLVGSSSFSLLDEIINTGVLPGTSVLETYAYDLVPFERFQSRLWHPLYFYSDGECIQFNIYFSPAQMKGYELTDTGLVKFIALQDFQLHAMVIYATPTSIRMQ